MDNTPVRVLLDIAYQARKDLDGEQFAETLLLSPHEQFFHSIQNDLLDVSNSAGHPQHKFSVLRAKTE